MVPTKHLESEMRVKRDEGGNSEEIWAMVGQGTSLYVLRPPTYVHDQEYM